MRKILLILALPVLFAAACQPQPPSVAEGIPTATLAPIVSQTPRLTATPVPTRTPIPTFTPIPDTPTMTFTPSDTPTPTEEPPILGRVNSLDRVNVRTGPGITYNDFEALEPNSEIEIIGQSSDGNWLNVRLQNGDEGWMAARLIRLLPTPTTFPTFTPTTDLTAVALGTVFPTAVIGGGTVTPTPGGVATSISPTPVITREGDTGEQVASAPTLTPSITPTPRRASIDSTPVLLTFTPSPSPTNIPTLVVDESVLPVIDVDALNATATALSVGGVAVIPTPTPIEEGDVLSTRDPTETGEGRILPTPLPVGTDDEGSIFDFDDDEEATEEADATVTAEPGVVSDAESSTVQPQADRGTPQSSTEAIVRNGVDVLAYCDDPAFDAAPPDNLKAGSTVDVYWIWYASEEQYIQEQLDNAIYDVRINGNRLTNLRQYRQPVQAVGNDFAVSWYAPIGPLAAGEYEVTYRVSWNVRTFDGYQFYGPGTNTLEETGTCTFTVYE